MADLIKLRTGNRLYHGTPDGARRRALRGPAWFSDYPSVAEWFATGLPRFLRQEPKSPRVFEYRVRRSPTLLVFRNEDALRRFSKAKGFPSEREPGFYSAATGVCAEEYVDGWLVRDVYDPDEPGGDFGPKRGHGAIDLMLCAPEAFLERTRILDLQGLFPPRPPRLSEMRRLRRP
jgi:hypothetical protein